MKPQPFERDDARIIEFSDLPFWRSAVGSGGRLLSVARNDR
ncbi:hypothetical protein [Bradyrhizobium zhanjiangense]|nr:hypothetical protein [Bradyrhizobium zhanjiangense]